MDSPLTRAVPASTLAGSPEGLCRLRELTGVVLESLMEEAARRDGAIPRGGPAAFRGAANALPDTFVPELGQDPVEVVRALTELAARWAVDVTKPGAVGRMQCAPTGVAVAMDLAAAALNQGLQAWESGPFAAMVEQRLLGDLARLVGYPRDASGSVTSGGSASNLMGLLLARDDAIRRRTGLDPSEAGLWRLSGLAPRLVCTTRTHVSVRRAARLLGLGSDAVVVVESDRVGRMRPEAADAALAGLGSGELPVALVATAGTTDFGAFDPLDEIADVAAKHALWLHVDAAYGAGALFSRRLAHLVDGIGRADSIALDLHKFGWTHASSGVFLTRRPAAMSALAEGAAYLSTPEDAAHGFVAPVPSLQTTRRADALKIAATLLALGRSGVEQMVDRCRELALHAARVIDAHPLLELAEEPILTTVVFRCCPRAAASRDGASGLDAAVRRRLIEQGRVLLGRVVVPDASGRPCDHLKLILLTPTTTERELDAVIGEIAAAVEEVGRE